jgi:hypothetical protein
MLLNALMNVRMVSITLASAPLSQRWKVVIGINIECLSKNLNWLLSGVETTPHTATLQKIVRKTLE